ncbi:hypothetical protein K7711_34255 [Nocardia sp. CA2R105]|uniref:hypothetical protein n=1 Tax=Nocardia coffeae TaxID=2873381 RepID=UPI001CA6E2DB|nr:hypothetical protein [Nocardia coffeae]MBY8861583.1 hypothetical protein [Nocardia coffeae]
MPISFETGGLQQLDQNTWGDPKTRDIITLTYIDAVPDLPAPLEDEDRLRRRLTELQAEFGCLLEAHSITVNGQPALLRLEKFPLPDRESGLGFTAGIVVPKATCSAILKIMCPENGRPGAREAAVVPKVGFPNMFPPHPYAPDVRGKLPYNAADDMRWDSMFPDHALSRARAWIVHASRTAKIDPRYAALPAFTGPSAVSASVSTADASSSSSSSSSSSVTMTTDAPSESAPTEAMPIASAPASPETMPIPKA